MRDAVAVWLVLSIVLEIGTSVGFYVWLRRRTSISPALYGFPGYLERRYLEWCREQGIDGRLVIGVRVFLHLNLVVAAIVGIPLVFG